MHIIAVIPARFASTRFPGKPLAPLADKPLIQHVVERVRLASGIADVLVATDDVKIAQAVEAFGGNVVMTSSSHLSGTDRVAEVARTRMCDVVVNVQGDEPLIDPEDIEVAVQALLGDPDAQISTLMAPLGDDGDNPNVVKVAVDEAGHAMYFSRSLIPDQRNFRHVGLYCYRRGALLKLASLDPTANELAETLEQVRALDNGMTIRVEQVESAAPGVDTPEDLERVRQLLAEGHE